ncbi:N-acetyl-gamma-glutamyl-phosphate reductase [Pseudofulvimonas gallinarii]|uniref:N-acetyl-gamma-glutamyl-phosphate reductase n=1 Tax=Pseudofulvimonas gallinarii TaxID=634155 RepID=A0A4R3LGI5_9GAMM|nr:N-acetyl-gamma-glutamyl-phosphate reductase [Pseudofulvimonas gallinarii]TCS99253.1 N-acetyl-gamma-glutamyl-phosphate reductase [Pseudofulvimonas gallinarii]THD13943.1 N-acetyl-gamma-glutamyl-phosphate reductase [Pseudofulvimonas gallinarii]
MSTTPRLRVGLVGARGHTGSELVRLLANHPAFELAWICSRELTGQRLADHADAYRGDLRYIAPDPAALPALGADAVILALPNGKAAGFVAAFDGAGTDVVIIDLSADYRFDDRWFYGLPELTRARYRGERRISNPGCYATAMQLALAPVVALLDGPAQCFGVSGYSGAGTTPSDRNDVDKLRDNLMPYALADHIHEREVSRQLAHAVEFMPHVAPHFRGITLTANVHLREPLDRDTLVRLFRQRYEGEPLARVVDDAPWVSAIAGRHHAEIGAFTIAPGGRRAVVVATLDNLLKGAATQAVQNLNLAFGRPECEGIPT